MDCSLPAPLTMGFSRQEYWTGLPCPSPGDLPDPGIEPVSPALQVNSLPLSYREGRGPQEAPMGLPGKGKSFPSFGGPELSCSISHKPHSHSQPDPNRFGRDRLFSAVARGAPEDLAGLPEYLRRTSKYLTDSEYRGRLLLEPGTHELGRD